jgi:hypothetical protein
MSSIRSFDLNNLASSDTSSETSDPKNKERLRSFKEISAKKGSFMQHILHSHEPAERKTQSSTLFQSERWNFKPITAESLKYI